MFSSLRDPYLGPSLGPIAGWGYDNDWEPVNLTQVVYGLVGPAHKLSCWFFMYLCFTILFL